MLRITGLDFLCTTGFICKLIINIILFFIILNALLKFQMCYMPVNICVIDEKLLFIYEINTVFGSFSNKMTTIH